jgi:hypothetical protein
MMTSAVMTRVWPALARLLLDGERPQMTQQWRILRREVRHVGEEHLPPVGEVEDRRQEVVAQLADLVVGEQQRPHRHHHQHHEERGQQAPCAPVPELLQSDALVFLGFLEQQRRDEKTADDEEHLDADETTLHPAELGVVEDDGDHRECTQTIERGHVPHRRRLEVAARGGNREVLLHDLPEDVTRTRARTVSTAAVT